MEYCVIVIDNDTGEISHVVKCPNEDIAHTIRVSVSDLSRCWMENQEELIAMGFSHDSYITSALGNNGFSCVNFDTVSI